MHHTQRARSRGPVAAVATASATAVVGALLVSCGSSASASPTAAVQPPPAGAVFDYQIGEPYTPASDVEVVTRDYTEDPADGLYNICYVNAFQAQPGAEKEWGDLLLEDANGDVVYDDDWGEAVLDIRTDDKREKIAAKVNAMTDTCADAGYDAVEPDNLDTFSRFEDLIGEDDAKAFVRLLADHAHERGLAIGQKNTPAFSTAREETGLDFAVSEECGEWDECGDYTEGFGDDVIVIEYDEQAFDKTCREYGDRLSVVLRDLDVTAPGDDAYVRETC
ncbi:endo alpha-1,4 polygalactosaminidase [Streptomyces sp. CRN 30]|uniref:endo alpha-1,4 polygalactosaminidase n=1 Tax=Streptomyces sp. CRN 30 TaxID=3075613 RepID=UPI002A7FD2DF|nr:endo alpha-1,4 polygalactosaminidase [Streptomyces sp. CRN 30]